VESASDAGIFKVSDDIALVQSLDFFTPVVDDPYEFGQIAAANALSDLYAMGAVPVTAMNLLCFPCKDLDSEIAGTILKGGIDKVHEAGAVLVGGHSVDDTEPKFGLSVTGIVHPERYVTNSGAQKGDVLFLTKPIGTGVLATALKAGLVSDELRERMISIMSSLNKVASEVMMEVGVNSATDITGFGLAGHGLEMAVASGVRLVIEAHKVPVIAEALDFLRMGLVPEGDYANRSFCEKKIKMAPGVDTFLGEMLFDAQTSGGLLISVEEGKADHLFTRFLEEGLVEVAPVGWVEEGEPSIKILP